MQASQARWAVVTLCMLGSLGCQSGKGWWPGQKPLAYSQSSATPPAVAQQGQQTQPYQQAPAYTDQTGYNQMQQGAAAPGGYAANAYPIGHASAQDSYGTAGQPATGAGGFSQGYPQAQQPLQGAYPEQYPNAANPYAQPGASMGGYADSQAGAGYSANPPYQQAGANPYAAPGYNQTRTADSRNGGYSTNSPYDAAGYGAADPGQYNSAAPASGPPVAGDPYQPGQTGYQPGQTGYNAPGAAPYQMPAAGAGDAPYRPGSTKDYSPSGATGADYGQPPAASAPAGYGNPPSYPATSAAQGGYNPSAYPTTPAATGGYGGPAGYPSASASPAVDRYGRPIQQASSGYSDPTLQR